MKQKILLGIGILSVLIILASCTPGGGQNVGGGIGGNGLTLSWVPNVPPLQLYDDQQFEADVELTNNGAYTIGTSLDRIYISGFSRERITGSFTDGQQLPPLEGQTRTVSGGKDVTIFKGNIAFLNTQNSYTIPLTATACYEYVTEAGGNICIDPAPFTTSKRAKSCTAGTITLGSQGAPVKVSSATAESSPGKTRITISISNTGGGEAFKKETLPKCNPYS